MGFSWMYYQVITVWRMWIFRGSITRLSLSEGCGFFLDVLPGYNCLKDVGFSWMYYQVIAVWRMWVFRGSITRLSLSEGCGFFLDVLPSYRCLKDVFFFVEVLPGYSYLEAVGFPSRIPIQGRRRRGAAGACAPALSKVGGTSGF